MPGAMVTEELSVGGEWKTIFKVGTEVLLLLEQPHKNSVPNIIQNKKIALFLIINLFHLLMSCGL